MTAWVYGEYLRTRARSARAREKSLKDLKDDSLNRFMKDLAVDREKNPSAAAADRWDPSTEEGDDDDDDVGRLGVDGTVHNQRPQHRWVQFEN